MKAGTIFMLYSFAKVMMTGGLRFFFRRLYVTGIEHIPEKGPVIIIANHHSSLMDAALLGILLKRKAWFFARGDVFEKTLVRKLLWRFHMMPVHGHHLSRTSLNVNADSFASGKEILAKGGIIVFFPESTSHTDYQLLPFRKGVFRLAFDTAALHRFSFDIPIVPVGIYYDDPVHAGQCAHVHAGKPLLLSHYVADYRLNPAAAMLKICKDAQQRMQDLVLHIDDAGRMPLARQALLLSRHDHEPVRATWIEQTDLDLLRDRQVCENVNQAPEAVITEMHNRATAYAETIDRFGLHDDHLARRPFSPAIKLLLWLGLPLYGLCLLLSACPLWLARSIADKKVYRQDFYSWIFVACASMLFLLWWVSLAALSLFAGWTYALCVLVAIPVAGIFALNYRQWLAENRYRENWAELDAQQQRAILAMRSEIVKMWEM